MGYLSSNDYRCVSKPAFFGHFRGIPFTFWGGPWLKAMFVQFLNLFFFSHFRGDF